MKKNPPKRILVFNVNWLGDVLFSTAAIRNIRYNFPSGYLACVIPSRCYPVLKGNPHLDEVIIFDEHDRHRGLLAQLKFIRELKAKRFDAVFLLHRSLRRALLCRIAGIPERIGYDTKKRGFLLTKKIPPPDPHTMHRIDYYLNVIEKAGLKLEDRYTEFFFSEDDAAVVEGFLAKKKVKPGAPLVGVNPGGNWMPKRWPKNNWALLCDKLIQKLGATVVITGGAGDLPLAEAIRGSMHSAPVIACGAFSLKQLAAFCKKTDLFITADTGPLHIANSVGTRHLIALFGPTDPAITGPAPALNAVIMQKKIGCKIPCYQVHCKDRRCMKALASEDVFEEARRILAGRQK